MIFVIENELSRVFTLNQEVHSTYSSTPINETLLKHVENNNKVVSVEMTSNNKQNGCWCTRPLPLTLNIRVCLRINFHMQLPSVISNLQPKYYRRNFISSFKS